MVEHHVDEGLSTTGGYAMIPGWVAEQLRGLGSAAAWSVYYEIARRAAKKRFAWPSQQRIADDTGLGIATVERAIRALRDMGAIAVSARTSPGKGKQGNTYTVVFEQPNPSSVMERLPRTITCDGSAPIISDGSVNKDELQKNELQKNSLSIISLSESDTPDPRTPDSVRDLPFTDREQSASDAPRIETGSPNQAPPPLEGKALRAADAIGLPDPEWATEWHEWLQDRKDRRLPNTPRALNKQLELLRSDSDPKGVLEAAMRCAWKGLFPSKPAKRGKPRLADEINRYLAQ